MRYLMHLKTTFITCDSCDANQFIQDLLAYDSVIQYASLDTGFGNGNLILNNGLTLRLVNSGVGISTGATNGIATTNDAGLNTIFINHGVRQYENTQVGTSYEKYELVCNCDANLLKQDLEAYNTVILSAENIHYGLLLSAEESEIEKTKIHPNPFKDTVNIETKSQIQTIVLFNILGEVVYETRKISDFKIFSETLHSGVYILKLVDQQGKTLTEKLIKN